MFNFIEGIDSAWTYSAAHRASTTEQG